MVQVPSAVKETVMYFGGLLKDKAHIANKMMCIFFMVFQFFYNVGVAWFTAQMVLVKE
jgi:hypothetical protein